MKIFFTLTKRRLITLFFITVICLLTAFRFVSIKAEFIDGSTHQKRILFINSLNVSVDEKDITEKKTVIPAAFGDVYNRYNDLQQQAGFNLKSFKGKSVSIYTYKITGNQKELHLIVCDGKIIGGDIADVNVNGEMYPLKR